MGKSRAESGSAGRDSHLEPEQLYAKQKKGPKRELLTLQLYGNTVKNGGQAATETESAKEGNFAEESNIIFLRCHICHYASNDTKQSNGNHADPGLGQHPEEVDRDGYSTTLEHRLAGIGNSCPVIKHTCLRY